MKCGETATEDFGEPYGLHTYLDEKQCQQAAEKRKEEEEKKNSWAGSAAVLHRCAYGVTLLTQP